MDIVSQTVPYVHGLVYVISLIHLFDTIHLFRAYGGVALSLGLLLYGYKVMKTIGYKVGPKQVICNFIDDRSSFHLSKLTTIFFSLS